MGKGTDDLAQVVAAMNLGKPITDPDVVASASAKADEKADRVLPARGELIRAAPAVGMICGTLVFLAILITFGVFIITGRPTDELFRLINLFFNALGAVGILFMLILAIRTGQRTLENRAYLARAEHQAHRAADVSESIARSVNGELEVRIQRAATHAAVSAAIHAVRQVLAEERRKDRGDSPPNMQ
jgi:hypothetical protein